MTETFTRQTRMPVSAAELFHWHEQPGAIDRLMPPWESVQIKAMEGEFDVGQKITFRTPMIGPIHSSWVAEIHQFVRAEHFADRQLSGPFASFEHVHRMIADGTSASYLNDTLQYRLPLGWLGRLLGGGMVRSKLSRMFDYRHRLTLSDLTRHHQYRDQPRKTIAISGSTGMIGSALTRFLTTGGHRVIRLVHGKMSPPPISDGTTWTSWDKTTPLQPETLQGCDAVIHLAGDNLASGRWNASKKQRIMESRTGPTRELAELIAGMDQPPKVLLSASAVGIYGDRGDELLNESSTAGTGFLAEVGQAWEDAAAPAKSKGVRVVHPRIGVVLTPKGGALAKQLPAFEWCAGATLGSGKQWISWITQDDLIGGLHHCLMNDSVAGPVNMSAPNPVTNRTFGKTLGKVLGRPVFMQIPGFMLRLMFGEMADAALLASTRASPEKLLASGFTFDYPELESGLRHVLGR